MAFLLLILGSLLLVRAYAVRSLDGLPRPGLYAVPAGSVFVYDRSGSILAERNRGGGHHIPLRLGEMGTLGPAATLAAEDREFYRHGALDPPSMLRAMIADTLARRPVQGGSTITQQLVKVELDQTQRSFGRKLREAVEANELEKRYSKAQILEMYLNRVYYGQGAYGLGAATKIYFGAGKTPKDLTVAQAAFLAGLINSPNYDNPRTHFDRARRRQLYVLERMEKTGQVTAAEAVAARREDVQKELVYDLSFFQERAPHFVDYVVRRLEMQVGKAAATAGGYEIHTTLDTSLQQHAEAAVRDGVAAMTDRGVNNGMLLAALPLSGEIVAWVGSVDYNDAAIGGRFDVIESPRQPGSSFKPYVYEAALRDRRITLASCLNDVPTDFNGYRPQDYDNRFMGQMSARAALVQSRNVPAVEVANAEGIQNVIKMAADFGIQAKLQPYLPTAIGASDITMLDNVQGYQVFANQGRKVPLMAITSIADRKGQVVYSVIAGRQPGVAQVIGLQETYLIADALKDYQDVWHLGWNRRMASKSGTSGGTEVGVHQDAWMMAYNRDIVVGSWAGNTAANGPGRSVSAFGIDTGSTMLAPFINSLPAQWVNWYQQPPGVVSAQGEVFMPGTENDPGCVARPAGDGGGGGGGGEGGAVVIHHGKH
ncbi:MAG: transglycosylase domain-containing protein [Candidatus Dormibacteria bacterium]